VAYRLRSFAKGWVRSLLYLPKTGSYGAPAYTANLHVPLTEAKTLLNGAKVLAMTLGTDGRTD